MTPAEIESFVARFAGAPARLRAAWDRVPEAARKWRPGPEKWSPHEVVVHCADAQVTAAMRLRFLLAEKDPVLVGYDQDVWARNLDYHAQPVEAALALVEAVHAHTVPLLRRQPADAWARTGTHTEVGPYSAETWLRYNSDHVDAHVRQIERIVAAFAAQR